MAFHDPAGAKDPYAVKGDLRPLPFTHGIEVEYMITTGKGQVFGHGAFERVYRMILNQRLKQEIESRLPEPYRKKVREISIAQSTGSSYEALFIQYDVRGSVVEAELVSVDRNVAEWPLIESATPPCDTLYELAWWSSTLQNAILSAVRATGLGASVLACGTSPMEDMRKIVSGESFPTCGEHHHIAVYSKGREVEFTRFYHLVRAFLPELVLLTAGSTFASGRPSGRIRLKDPEMPFPKCINTLRVIHNAKHMCDYQEGEYIPYLPDGWKGRDAFLEEFQKQTGSFRKDTHFFDVDPLSKGGTTEVRVFDSNPSVARRVGVAAVLQMLAHSAFTESEEARSPVLDIPSRDLMRLKRFACEVGPWARPTRSSMFDPPSKPMKRSLLKRESISDLLLEMFMYLHRSGVELGLLHSRFLYPLRHTVYGAWGRGVCLSQYWLMRYARNGGDMNALVAEMLAAVERAANIWYDPVVYEPVRFPQVTPGKGAASGGVANAPSS